MKQVLIIHFWETKYLKLFVPVSFSLKSFENKDLYAPSKITSSYKEKAVTRKIDD